MQVLALRLSSDVSLILARGDSGWRFSHWMRVADDRRLPEPPAIICEREFETPESAKDFFAELLGAPLAVRDRPHLESERDALGALVDKGDALHERWRAARRKVATKASS